VCGRTIQNSADLCKIGFTLTDEEMGVSVQIELTDLRAVSERLYSHFANQGMDSFDIPVDVIFQPLPSQGLIL
jgi:hypothetical protein